MSRNYNPKYPTVDDLRIKAKTKIPKFAFEYLDGGCNDNVNVVKNTQEIREVELQPYYLSSYGKPSLKTELFGHEYDAPFGVSPIGLQGLVWPKAPEILAKAAFEQNLPFILSTVSTSSIETISEITQGQAWFQLYHPVEDTLRDNLLQRMEIAGVKVLVLLCDVPTFGFRPADIKNGLSMPPRMTLANICQIAGRPEWALRTLLNGSPSFETLKPYIPKSLNMAHLGLFMNDTFNGQLSEDKISAIRDKWKGKIVLKGVASLEDAAAAIKLGLDGIIVSNHGGRQLDAGQSSIAALKAISDNYQGQIKIMMDSGIRSGPDIARCLASGAEFTFMGRAFMYGVAALGGRGGSHTMEILKIQLQQVMDQLCCEKVNLLTAHRV